MFTDIKKAPRKKWIKMIYIQMQHYWNDTNIKYYSVEKTNTRDEELFRSHIYFSWPFFLLIIQYYAENKYFFFVFSELVFALSQSVMHSW